MTSYAEATEQNGVIVALDQEKAYDKISHDYLWRTLEKFNFPAHFINAVRSLYKHARSLVIINGEMSTYFQVTRGVRQGDPLSCLLFDLAIEPLACILRKSNLVGFQVPAYQERLVVQMFADDTTVFLSEHDNFEYLEDLLKKWCRAARAKFNVNKTEVIPIGTLEYRNRLLATRRISENRQPLDDSIHIAAEGEAVRILGAWIGNQAENAAPWSPIIQTITENLARWSRTKPTMYGKKLIIDMEVGGRTQYLAKVQGMPKQIQQTLTKIIRCFLWNGAKSRVALEKLYQPINKGGFKIMDLQARLQAIELTWLKSYLALGKNRPVWAFIADALIAMNARSSDKKIGNWAKINIFLQSWDTSARSKLPDELKRMLTLAKEHHVKFDALQLSNRLKNMLPIWFHFGAEGS